jgi:hypothetical protein
MVQAEGVARKVSQGEVVQNTWQFPGKITINGHIEAKSVEIYFGDWEYVTIRSADGLFENRRRSIELRPFTRDTLRISATEHIKTGYIRSASGTKLGSCSENFGHPADNEHVIWDMERFELECHYTADKLDAEIMGSTSPGRPTRDGFHHGSLDPLKIAIQFSVRRTEMTELFGQTDVKVPPGQGS